jgi:hypothetical protein
VKRDIGETFTVVFWHEPHTILEPDNLANVRGAEATGKPYYDTKANATVVKVPIAGVDENNGLTITVPYELQH